MKGQGIVHRAAQISLANGLATVLSLGIQIVSVPICLKYWGSENYGSWLALSATFLLIRSVDGGFVNYVGNKVNCTYHENEQVARAHLASATFGIGVIAIVQLIVALLGLAQGALSREDTAAHSATTQASLALLILTGTWAFSGSYLGIVHRLMVPTGLMYQAVWWGMALQVGQFIAIVLAAFLRCSIVSASVLVALAQSTNYLASALYIRHKLPRYYPWWRGADLRMGIRDLVQSFPLSLSQLIQQGTVSGAVLLVSALAGPSAVPAFTTVRTLANLWTNVTNVLTSPLLPEIVRFHAAGEGHKLLATTKAYWTLVGITVNLAILLSYPAIDIVYARWTANAVALNRPLLCCLLGSIAFANAGGVTGLFLSSINRLGTQLATSLVRALVSLPLGAVLFVRLGMLGLGAAILLGEVLAQLIQLLRFARVELPHYGVSFQCRAAGPVALAQLSILAFLATESFGLGGRTIAYFLALVATAAAGVWGWTSLEQDVRHRLTRVFAR